MDNTKLQSAVDTANDELALLETGAASAGTATIDALRKLLTALSEQPSDDAYEYAIARREWPSVPVHRRRDRESANSWIANPPIGEAREGWLIIRRPKPGQWNAA